ncbi:helix-turn-helix domain-containing protein [Deinococcus peraridilitoris]|nr:helix-turn-helix transcriptional regulator [Deinococcus peraridilitoris]
MTTKLEPREWLREVRQDRNMRQEDIEAKTAELGAKISQSHLSKIERGHATFSSLGPERMDALRRALRISPEEWAANTGLKIVSPEDVSPASTKLDVTAPPPLEVTDSLREAIERFAKPGSRYADMGEDRWLRLLTNIDHRVEPETPEEWLEVYIDLSKHINPK